MVAVTWDTAGLTAVSRSLATTWLSLVIAGDDRKLQLSSNRCAAKSLLEFRKCVIQGACPTHDALLIVADRGQDRPIGPKYRAEKRVLGVGSCLEIRR